MDELTKAVLSAKILEICDCDINSAIYSFIPLENENAKLYTHSLHNLPQNLDSAIEIFTGEKTQAARNSISYSTIKEGQEKSLKLLNETLEFVGYKGQKKIGKQKIHAALGCISHIYLDTFAAPVQFFLPHSPACSGKWDFWDNIDFFSFQESLQDRQFNFSVREKLAESRVWDIKLNLSEFPFIVQRRLIREKSLNKKFAPEAMIKAMIIRLGEMGRPFINYEVIDFSIREFFTYLGAKKYLRVDREMEFLKKLDNEIMRILKESL